MISRGPDLHEMRVVKVLVSIQTFGVYTSAKAKTNSHWNRSGVKKCVDWNWQVSLHLD